MTMTLTKVKEALKEWIKEDKGLQCPSPWVSWRPGRGRGEVCLDGDFTIEELMAIAIYIKAVNDGDL